MDDSHLRNQAPGAEGRPGLPHSPARLRSEIEAELRFHVEAEVERLVAVGWSPPDARDEVLRRFGDLSRVEAECEAIGMEKLNRERRAEVMDTVIRDIRYALRGFRQNPLFTFVAVLTIALGIAASTAVFTVVDAVLFRPLPFQEPERLVSVWEQNREQGIDADNPSPPNYADWVQDQSTFTDLAAWSDDSFTLTGGDRPEEVVGVAVTPNFFQTLGVAPAEGRFPDAEDQDAGNRVVVSRRLADRYFDGVGAVGRTLSIDGNPREIVAVMPSSFQAPRTDIDLWAPTALANYEEHRQSRYLFVLGRLAPDVTLEQAEADLDQIAARLAELYPESNSGWEADLISARDQVVGDSGPLLLMVLAAVGLVLLIACVNVANLLLGRAASRAREFDIRTAVGAGRGRIVGQLITESVLLALVGGAIGIILAHQMVSLFLRLEPGAVPRLDEVTVDLRVLAFVCALSLVTAVVFGLVPALRAAGGTTSSSLGSRGSRSSAAGPGSGRLRKALVVGEVAMSLVLLVAAGLFLRSFFELRSVDPGFDRSGVLAAKISLNDDRYPQSDDRVLYFTNLIEAIEAVPGVRNAAVTSTLPMDPTGTDFDLAYHAEGFPWVGEDEASQIDYRIVSPGYLDALSIPLVAGRDFTDFDRRETAPVLLVNESFARAHWPGEEAIGKRVTIFYVNDTEWEVVGVVGDTRHHGLSQPARAQMFVPMAQAQYLFGYMTVVVASAPGVDVSSAVRQAAVEVDPNEPLFDLVPLTALMRQSIARDRFVTIAFGLFGVLALLLATAGMYGVISYQVVRRTREIGVRMALGARSRTVLGQVLGEAVRMSLAGAALGLVGAFVMARVLRSFLFEVGHLDPVIFAGVPVLLVAVAAAAALIPARRAALIDPVKAIRED